MKVLFVIVFCLVAATQDVECTSWKSLLKRRVEEYIQQRGVVEDCRATIKTLFDGFINVEEIDEQSMDRKGIEDTCVDAGGPDRALDILGKCMDEEEAHLPARRRLILRLLDLLEQDKQAEGLLAKRDARTQCAQGVPILLLAFKGDANDPHYQKWLDVCIRLGGVHGTLTKMTQCVEAQA